MESAPKGSTSSRAKRNNPVETAAVKLFAQRRGLSERSAHRHRERNSPEWQSFNANAQGDPIQEAHKPDAPPEQSELTGEAFLALPEAQQIYIGHWRVWLDGYLRWEKAANNKGKDDAEVTALASPLKGYHQEYIKARQDFESWQASQRATFTAAELEETRQKYWIPFIAKLRGMPQELAAMCPHDIREEVQRQASVYLEDKLTVFSDRLLDNLESGEGS